jgi:hypothetical protein
MILVILALVFWLIFFWIIYYLYLISYSFAVLFVFIYFCITRALYRYGRQSLWLRNCALVRALQRMLCDNNVVEIDAPPNRRVMYAAAPHGLSCFGFAASFVPSLRGRVRLLASPIFVCIPLLRDIWYLAGVVTAQRETFDACIARGENIAVIPSGIEGLYYEIVTPVEVGSKIIDVYRVRSGFLALAIKHRMLLVPVLSCGEHNVYWKCTLSRHTPLLAFLTTLVFPRYGRHVITLAAEPIDCARYVGRLGALDDAYHRALQELGKKVSYTVRIIDKPRFFQL